MNKKQKLELTWIGKENRPRLEPRILLEDPEKSYHAKYRVNEPKGSTAKNAENAESIENPESLRSLRSLRLNDPGDLFDNRLILHRAIPHDAIAENMTLKGLAAQFTVS